jgi:large repetitive protein
MKPISVPARIAFIIAFFTCAFSHAQNINVSASAVWMTKFSKDTVFNVTGTLGSTDNIFTGNNFGVHVPNSHTLFFRGGQLIAHSTSGMSEVCSARMYYRVYLQGSVPGAFSQIDFFFGEDCEFPPQFNSGGSCSLGDQKFDLYLPDGVTDPYAPLDLTALAIGNYIIEVYYAIDGLADCSQTVILNNGGNNYKASFSIQNPSISGTSSTTCNGLDGYITIGGLMPTATYSVRYTDDGNSVGPIGLTADASGQINISGLNAGVYSGFKLGFNGTTTDINSTITLVNQGVMPKFKKIDPFCKGSTAPILPNTSQNGITGTWNPAVIDNQASNSYQFTPDAGQCASIVVINVIVIEKITPSFSFGTAVTLCVGATPPALYKPSDNGVTGTWSPSTINNQNSGAYTFDPNPNQCANQTTFTVTINPIVIPMFSFGTALTICAGSSVPALSATSVNGIAGTWSPATVDNQNSATYTFTPAAGQCATTTNFNVTVNPVLTPVFSFGSSLSICAGGGVPSLSTTSTNGITGTWSPSTVNNQASGVYTFTPSAGACAPSVTFAVTVASNIIPTFSFGTALTICAGNSVPALPNTSTNGIAGTWSPATIDNQNSGIYTFTPGAGQCATTASFSVTVNPKMPAIFSFGSSLTTCAGANVPSLVTTSNNGITGTWLPSIVDNQNSGTYTFTPSSGQCGLPASLSVTVNPTITPVFSFGPLLSICTGGSVPSLPTTSSNGINGTWNPTIVDNQNSGTYTFTPTSGQCVNSISFTVNVTPSITPTFTFGTSLSICNGGAVPSLPAASTNGITGTWSSATVDNLNSGTYLFTPDAGQCAISTSFVVTVNPVLIPTFNFGTSMTICAGTSVPSLPTTSVNGITGTWNPSVIDNHNPGTYTFTPIAGQCATPTSLIVTVTQNITPAFSLAASLTICAGTNTPLLPVISDNGINGTWSPSIVSNQNSGTYTFTSSAGQCATTTTFTVTVNPILTPTFSFGTSMNICAGASVSSLPNISDNGIAGTWNPSSIDNQNSGIYTFTPAAGQCVTSATLTVTVNAIVIPLFNLGTTLTICAGSNVPVLPAVSTNGIRGAWNPRVVDNQNSATYTFTPIGGQCAAETTVNVIVNPKLTPTFNFGTSLTICAGNAVPILPTTSSNGITGTWSPAIVDNQSSGTYTFTSNAGQCTNSTIFVVTVNQSEPIFNFGTALTICAGGTVPLLPATSDNGITGSWSPKVISNQTPGTYIFTPNPGQCASVATFNVTVTTVPVINEVQDMTVTDGSVIPAYIFTGTPVGVDFSWTNSNSFIGLGTNGSGNVPSFTATNSSDNPIKATITVTPGYNGCVGTASNYVITVMPLNKDIFVANIFTPNGDGRNDIFYARGNYIKAIEIRIFNQYGRQIELITDPKKGWDGRSKGVPQPVGVYMYVLKATMTDGRTIQLKGDVTLLR